MGYCISMKDSKFAIRKENKEKALDLLKQFVKKIGDLTWVDCSVVLESETLYEALEECRYELEEDSEGNVVDIYFVGEKIGEDHSIFNSIAPAIEDGSYIEMLGEDGCLWRWIFNDGVCKEKDAKILWE